MKLAAADLTMEEKLPVAITCHGIVRTVAYKRLYGDSVACKGSLKLFISEGLRGSRARKEIATTASY
eukprot:4393360-Karenia_brevis.AAC.1